MELKGKYKLQRRLGGGGMAEVFVGTAIGARGFTRDVAIKRILPAFWSNAEFAQMFIAEAQVSATLSHPNVVSVIDFDTDADGGLFLVMELVQGVDLHQLGESGPLPISVIIHVIAETLRGLGYAHNVKLGGTRLGVVHRDVSPHNILLSWEGAVKVSDFGLAKARSSGAASASEVLKGKPAYMSPEQANSQAIDGRSDLFAVGVILWELLAGRRLFHADDLRATLAALFFKPIPVPSEFRANVPVDLERVAMKLLERDLASRYQSAEEAVGDMLACAGASGGADDLIATLVDRFPQIAPSREHRVVVQASLPPATANRDTKKPATFRRALFAIVVLTVGVGLLAHYVATQPRSTVTEFEVAKPASMTVVKSAAPEPKPSSVSAQILLERAPPQCLKLLELERRVSICSARSATTRASYTRRYDDNLRTFRSMLDRVYLMGIICDMAAQTVLPTVDGCPELSQHDADTARSDVSADTSSQPQIAYISDEDRELIQMRQPNCSRLVKYVEARLSCTGESEAARGVLRTDLAFVAQSYFDAQLNPTFSNALRPGDERDQDCFAMEQGLRRYAYPDCDPKD